MKSKHIDNLGTLMEEAITAAARQKHHVRQRLHDLRGDFGSTPVRGPWKSGRPGVKWHLYQAARLKHALLTQDVATLAWALKQITGNE